MNKKLVLLLLPLLVIPVFSFGYAHYTDKVEKKYKIHVGSIEANFTYFHVDRLKTIDTNCNGRIWGDEINITIYNDPATCTWYVLITCNPIPPSFELDTTMVVHNVGKLPWEAYWEVRYWGPHDEDHYGCFDGWNESDFEALALYPTGGRIKDDWDPPPGGAPYYGWYLENGLIYDINFWKDGNRVQPTGELYHPCTNLTVTQNLTLLQPFGTPVTDPDGVTSDQWQKNIQCHWFLIWVKIIVQNRTPDVYSSATWENGRWIRQGNIP